jgi:hypothetical protein
VSFKKRKIVVEFLNKTLCTIFFCLSAGSAGAGSAGAGSAGAGSAGAGSAGAGSTGAAFANQLRWHNFKYHLSKGIQFLNSYIA